MTSDMLGTGVKLNMLIGLSTILSGVLELQIKLN